MIDEGKKRDKEHGQGVVGDTEGGWPHALWPVLTTVSSSPRPLALAHTVSLLCMRLSSRQRHFVLLVLRVQKLKGQK